MSGWHRDVFPTSTDSSREEQVFSQPQVWVLSFLLSVRIMSQWKYRGGTDRPRDKVTGSVVYSSQRATENDFCSWNKTKTRVEGQLPFLFWLISTPRRPFPNVSGLLTIATRFKTPQAVLTYSSWALEGNKRGKCFVSTELTKSSMAPGSPCSDPNLIRLQAQWVLFVKCPHTHANPPPWLPPAPATMLMSSLSWMTATAFY